MTNENKPGDAAAVTPVVAPAKKLDLGAALGRQINDYHCGPDWPELTSLTKASNYVLRPDGLYALRNVPAGLFIAKMMSMPTGQRLPGFTKDDLGEQFILRYGKIPGQNLQDAVDFFREVCNENENEVYLQIFWDPKKNLYWNHVPYQRVSKASVKYDRNEETERDHVLVCELHSHNTMGAYFSSIDDADEKSDRIFGVVGELQKNKPAMIFSYVCSGKRVQVKAEDIFDSLVSASRFPEWKSRVSFNDYRNGSSSYGPNWSSQGSAVGQSGSGHGHWNNRGREGSDEYGEFEEFGYGGWHSRGSGNVVSGVGSATTGPSSAMAAASATIARTPQEIKSEVDKAGQEALKDTLDHALKGTLDQALKGHDFLANKVDVDMINEEIKAGLAEQNAAKGPILLGDGKPKTLTIVKLPPNTELKISSKNSGSEVPASGGFFPQNGPSRARPERELVRIDESMAVWEREERLKTQDLLFTEAILTVKKKLNGQKYTEAWMDSADKETMLQDMLAFFEDDDVNALIKVLLDMNHDDKIIEQLKPHLDARVAEQKAELG